MPGPEDFEPEPLPKPARIFVSSQNRRALDEAGEFAQGGTIFQLSLEPGAVPEPMTLAERDALPFHPHGIAAVARAPFPLLYVINHPVHHSHVIEIFEVRMKELRFVRRLRSPLLISPNDLVALPDGHIYVTNDHGTEQGVSRLLEDLLALRKSNVVRYDGVTWRIAAENIAFANGIAVSQSGDRLFVGSSRDRGIYVYSRLAGGALNDAPRFVDLNSGADNLMWETPEWLNVAAHPSALDFLAHARDSASPSPSEVFRVHAETLRVARVYRDPGTQISASSTALVMANRLLVSQVFEDFAISCDAPAKP